MFTLLISDILFLSFNPIDLRETIRTAVLAHCSVLCWDGQV